MLSCPTGVSNVPPACTDGRRQRLNANVTVTIAYAFKNLATNKYQLILVEAT
jgi:hypothetical protein